MAGRGPAALMVGASLLLLAACVGGEGPEVHLHDEAVRTDKRAMIAKFIAIESRGGRSGGRAVVPLGVDQHLAANTAGSDHGPWRLSNFPALTFAPSNAFFTRPGLASFASRAAA